MKHPVTGERCYKLTPAMLEAMESIQEVAPYPFIVRNKTVRIALVRRGFIQNTIAGAPPERDGVFVMTKAGRTALRIARAQGIKSIA